MEKIRQMARVSEGELIARDGVKLFYKTWHKGESTSLKAVVLFLQGMGKHVDHYQFMGDELSAHGIRVHCFDFRGQGETLIRNSDKLSRGNIGTLDQVKADIDLFLTGLDLDVSVPRILGGLSMGGLLSLMIGLDEDLLAKYKLSSILAVAPAIKIHMAGWQRFLMSFGRDLLPNLTVPGLQDQDAFTRDKAAQKWAANDPKCMIGRINVRTVATLMDASKVLLESPGKSIACPVGVIVGDADVITPAADCKEFLDTLTCADKTLVIIPDGRHSLYADIVKEEAVRATLAWIEKHTGNPYIGNTSS